MHQALAQFEPFKATNDWRLSLDRALDMAFPSGTAYHADSDADDEYERSVVTSPTHLHTDSETSPTDSDPPSTEHTPTTYGDFPGDRNSPRTVISEWTADECADFVAGLGLRQYCEAFLGQEQNIDTGGF